MYKKNTFTSLIRQIAAVRRGVRIACGMIMAPLRSIHTACAFLLMGFVFLLYYFDEISRSLLGGGSFIARALILMIEFDYKRQPSGFTVNQDIPGVQWLLHLPEYFIVCALFALISLIIVHLVKSKMDQEQRGLGRATLCAFKSWRFIILYALFMSIFLWIIGDIYLMVTRFILALLYESSGCLQYLHDPIYGKKVLNALIATRYWLPNYVRLAIAGLWYFGTFLLFAVVASERCSFFEGIWRSWRLAIHNISLVMSAALTYLFMYGGVMAGMFYFQAATFPSLEGMGTKNFVQIIALFAFMALVLLTVHATFISTGALMASVLIYRISAGQSMPKRHLFSVYSPYESFAVYLILFLFFSIIMRCGIHVQMPLS